MKEIIDLLVDVSKKQSEMLTVQKVQQKTLEKHTDIMSAQEKTLLRNTITVEEHKKGSIALQEQLKALKQEMEPARQHVVKSDAFWEFVRKAGWALGLIAAGSSAIYGIIVFLKG
ncbi:MAG: hypothetical protein DRN81_02295 [Thermoproteota archaeon]|nr:MAG: hypothetical protein DRN81_02295 [Candidatus Korarchaeota archaeon]